MMPILSGTTRSAWPRSNHLRTAGHRTAREAIRGTTGESAHCAGLPPGSATLARIPGTKTSIPGQLLQQSVHAARTDHPGTFGVGRRDIRTGYRHYRHHSLFQNGPVGATKVTWQRTLLNRRALLRRLAGAKQRIRRLLAPAAPESTNPTHEAGPVRNCLRNRRDGDGLPAVRCREGWQAGHPGQCGSGDGRHQKVCACRVNTAANPTNLRSRNHADTARSWY